MTKSRDQNGESQVSDLRHRSRRVSTTNQNNYSPYVSALEQLAAHKACKRLSTTTAELVDFLFAIEERKIMIQPFIALVLITTTRAMPVEEVASNKVDPRPAEAFKTSLTLQPFSLLFQSVTGGVETALSDKMSAVFNLSGTFRETSIDWSGGSFLPPAGSTTQIGGTAEAGINVFVRGHAPAGLWVGPRAQFEFDRFTSRYTGTNGETADSSYMAKRYGVGGSLLAGYNAIFDNGLTVQVGIGAGAIYHWSPDSHFLLSPQTGGPEMETIGATVGSHDWSVGARGLLALGWSI